MATWASAWPPAAQRLSGAGELITGRFWARREELILKAAWSGVGNDQVLVFTEMEDDD